jgi:hypothetical protein
MIHKLIGNERRITNKTFTAGESISEVARVRHNYPEGSEQGVFTITSDFGGELDSQDIPLEDGIITLSYSGGNNITQNVKVEIVGGDNNSVYATLAMLFSGGATLYFQSIPAGSVGNNITIKFQSGGERDIDIVLGDNIIITVTYELGDTFYDVFNLLDEASDYISYSYSGLYDITDDDNNISLNTSQNNWSYVCQIDSTRYVVAIKPYSTNVDYLKLVSIVGDTITDLSTNFGNISSSRASKNYTERIILIENDNIIYTKTYYYGYGLIYLFTINSNNTATRRFYTNHFPANAPMQFADMIWMKANYFIHTHTNSSNGYITLGGYTITPSYTATQLSQLLHSAGGCYYNSLVKISETRFVLFYSGSGSDGYAGIFDIDYDDDTISAVGSAIEHDTAHNKWNSAVNIGNYIVLAYTGNSNVNYLKTFAINGSDELEQIDSIQVSAYGSYNSVEIIDSHHVIVAYHNDNNHGIIKTYYIDDNGNIEFYMSVDHSDYAINHKLLKHTNSQYIALYSDATSQQIETFTLDIAEDFNLEAKEEQLTGGFTPELEILGLNFGQEASMNYLEMKQEILSRLDIEIANTDWLSRAESVIDAAIKRLIRERISDPWQFHGLHVVEQCTIDANGEVEIGGATKDISSRAFLVINIFSNAIASGSANYRYVRKDTKFIGLLNSTPDLGNVSDEIYYYRIGDKVYFYPVATASGEKVSIEYVEEPSAWESADELLDVFSYEFVQDALDIATERLRLEYQQ